MHMINYICNMHKARKETTPRLAPPRLGRRCCRQEDSSQGGTPRAVKAGEFHQKGAPGPLQPVPAEEPLLPGPEPETLSCRVPESGSKISPIPALPHSFPGPLDPRSPLFDRCCPLPS